MKQIPGYSKYLIDTDGNVCFTKRSRKVCWSTRIYDK